MKFEAVLFDCDGVLVDSELITNGVLRDMLAEQGWAM
ncbi:MAG: HAD family hydrolase, partial [Curvibacter sp.]